MAFDDIPQSAGSSKDFDAFPSTCACGASSVVAIATVAHKNTGQLKRGAASEFCGRDNNNNPDWVLQDWYALQDYRGYCSPCWNKEKLPGQRRFTDKQVRFAWRWMIGEIVASGDNEALSEVFQQIELTDEQRDKAVEIVNFEAQRCGNTESIPVEYQLQPEVA